MGKRTGPGSSRRSPSIKDKNEIGSEAIAAIQRPYRALEALGSVSQRACVGDGARRLQRGWLGVGLLSSRSRAFASLPLERRRSWWNFRSSSEDLLLDRSLERQRPDPERASLRLDR